MTVARAHEMDLKSNTGESIALPRTQRWPVPLGALVVFIAAVALSAPPILQLTEIREPNFYIHVAYAQDIAQTGVLYPGHFLYHLLMVAAHAVLPISWLQANVIVLLAARGFLAVVVWSIVRRSLPDPNSANAMLLATVVSLGLCFASAVTMFTWEQGNYYLGYISSNLYVSQTLTVLQPLALLLFFVTIRVVESSKPDLQDVVIMALLALLSVLAKPSYAMVLLPAVGVFLLIRGDLVRETRTKQGHRLLVWGRWLRDWRSVLILGAGLVVPIAAGIIWVYGSTYLAFQQLSVTESTGIRIAPFKVLALYQGGYVSEGFVAPWLLAKFMLSILFPLVVAVSFWPKVRHDARAILAWLQFGFGALFMYFLAEDPNYGSGNFTWSAHIAVFILFVVSVLVVIESVVKDGKVDWHRTVRDKAVLLSFGSFILHLIGGYGIYVHPYVN